MKVGIFAKTFEGTTPSIVLAAARQAGYRAVQYNMACSGLGPLPLDVSEEQATAVSAAAAAAGVEIAAVSATYNMIHPDPAERDRGRRSFAAIARVARTMGTRLLTVCTGSLDPQDQWRHHPDNAGRAAWRAVCEEFGHVLKIADEHDLLIGVEPEMGNVVSSAQRARDLIATLGSDRVRIVLDPANLFEVETEATRRRLIAVAVDLLADRIELAHAKDRFADGSFATAGRGVVDFPHYVAALDAAGFRGALVTHGLAAAEAPTVATFLADIVARAGQPR